MNYLEILSVWGWLHGSSEELELKIGEETLEIAYDKLWGAALAKSPQGSLCLTVVGAVRLSEHPKPGSVRKDLCPTPLRAPKPLKDPVLCVTPGI